MSSFLCSLLLTFIFASQLTTADVDQDKNFQYFCDKDNDVGNYTTNSTYHTNLNTLLTSNKEINYGFYNSSYGINSDKVNAIGLCRGDLKPNDCRNCLQNSTVFLTQLCQNRIEAIGWYDDDRCMLRYSNRSIFGLYDIAPYYEAWSLNTATNEDEFDKVRKNLLDNLRNSATSGDSDLKYAVGSEEVGPNNNQIIYGLAQCTPDLTKTFCDCLVQSINEIAICCYNRTGARVVRPSCYLRYETDSLFYQPTQDSPSSSSPSPTSVSSFAAPPPFAKNTNSYPGPRKLINKSIESFRLSYIFDLLTYLLISSWSS